jgi:hypothetical protein
VKKVEMMGGNRKTLIDQITENRYGVFPITAGSTWCGEWTEQRFGEKESLQEEEEKRNREVEEFAKRHPGALHRTIP